MPPGISVDAATKRLLCFEERLFQGERDDSYAAVQNELRELLHRQPNFVRTSNELDEYLQLALLFITTLFVDLGGRPRRAHKVCLAIHSSRHQVLIVKPSFYYRGRCAVLHPAISLARQNGIGQAGVSFKLREPIFCRRFADHPECGQYIHVQAHGGEPTSATLCIPLTANVESKLATFAAEGLRANGACTFDCPAHSAPDDRPAGAEHETHSPSAVLNIEFVDATPAPEALKAILTNSEFGECLCTMHGTLINFRAQRDRYNTLKACTSLFDLAHHSLSVREAYELLLRRVSKICDGADVTLHVRDMFEPENQSRAIRLIEGVGANFRGFLINDRQSIDYGVVGNEFRNGEGSNPTRRYRSEIEEALAKQDLGYRQLMPATVLNLALAIPEATGGPPIGVLNIEWSAQCGIGESDEEQRRYVDRKLPLLQRIAEYFTLVLQHFSAPDDVWAPDRESLPHRLEMVREQGNRRLSLSYHVGAVLDRLSKGKWSDHAGYAYGFLKDIIDAAGYLFSSERKLQFYLSCRQLVSRKVGDRTVDELVMAVEPHGMKVESGRKGDGTDRPGDPIPIPREKIDRCESVMAAAALARVPVSGELRPLSDGTYGLEPDEDCRHDLARREFDLPVVYRSSGTPQPIYEVAVPLVLGSELKAVIDFEQFSRKSDLTDQERKDLARAARREKDRTSFLQWARAIALCIGFSEDLRAEQLKTDGGGTDDETEYAVFLNLIASIIANVPIPLWVIEAVELDLVGLLVPATSVRTQLLVGGEEAVQAGAAEFSVEVDGSTAREGRLAAACRLPIRHQGESRGLLEVVLQAGHSDRTGAYLFPYVPESESMEMALRFLSAYKASLSLRADTGARESEEFTLWLRVAESLFEQGFKSLAASPALDTGELLRKTFSLLHAALYRALGIGERDGPVHSDYCWYVYHSEASIEGKGCQNTLLCRLGREKHLFVDTEERRLFIAEMRERKYEGEVEAYLREEPEPRAVLSPDALGSEVLLWILASHDYCRDNEDAGITSRTAATRKPQCYADVAPSPYRSADRPALPLLFGRHPYTILSVPILIEFDGSRGVQCLGVINFLRRRERLSDLRFFKAQDVEAAQDFVVGVARRLQREIHVETIQVRRGSPGGEAGLWPSAEALMRRLHGCLQGGGEGAPRWVVVVTELASSPADLERAFLQRLPEPTMFIETRKDLERALATNLKGKVCLLFATQVELADIGRLILDLDRADPRLAFIAVSPEQRQNLERALPHTIDFPEIIVEEQSLEENWKYALDLLAQNGDAITGGLAELHLLSRCAEDGARADASAVPIYGSRVRRKTLELIRSVVEGREWRPYLQAIVMERRRLLVGESSNAERP